MRSRAGGSRERSGEPERPDEGSRAGEGAKHPLAAAADDTIHSGSLGNINKYWLSRPSSCRAFLHVPIRESHRPR